MTRLGTSAQGRRPLERLVVTRPVPEAQAWVSALLAQGWPARARPLIEITAPQASEDLATLQHWRRHWAQADGILFVSAAAVQHFFARDVAASLASTRTRFWAPGPGTARHLALALSPLGIADNRIDAPPADAAQFDSEHLWPIVSSQVAPGRQVLIVRGTSLTDNAVSGPHGTDQATTGAVAGRGRNWLIEQCQAAGATVSGCVAYARGVPHLSTEDLAAMRSSTGAAHVWLFSSSEAIAALQSLNPPLDVSQASALVTHPRIAATAQAAGFGHVVQTRPALADVVRALESGWTPP